MYFFIFLYFVIPCLVIFFCSCSRALFLWVSRSPWFQRVFLWIFLEFVLIVVLQTIFSCKLAHINLVCVVLPGKGQVRCSVRSFLANEQIRKFSYFKKYIYFNCLQIPHNVHISCIF